MCPPAERVPSTAVAVIAELSTTYVTANIDETIVRKVREGQKVDVTLDAYPGRGFTGQVAAIEQVTDAALKGSVTSLTTSGTFTKVVQQLPVRIRLDEDVHPADIIGTNATVKISLQ
jgi:multidrug resistance efflux pump